MRARSTLSAIIGLVLITGACGRSAPDMPAASEFPAPGDPAKLVLKQPGNNAIELRFAPTNGVSDSMKMVMDMDMAVSAAGQSMKMQMGMSSDMTNSISEVNPDKTFKEKSLIENSKVTVGGDMASAIGDTSAIASQMDGQVTTITMDPQGRLLGLEMPDNPMMKQMGAGMDSALKGNAVSFPEQAVGVGAVWQALSRVDLMGIQMRFVCEYELLELNGKKGKVALRMRGGLGDGESGTIESMGGAKIKTMSFEGAGTINFDLERITAATMDLELKLAADIDVMNESGSIELKMKMKVDPK